MNNVQPRFLMMVGVAGSGKSTFAQELIDHSESEIVYLSSDKIREEIHGDENEQSNPTQIFELMAERTKKALKEGKNVIYDATNINRKRRKGLLQQLPKFVHKTAVYMATPFSETVTNNDYRERKVPYEVLSQMYKNLHIPIYSEGWNNIVYAHHDETLNTELPKQLADALRVAVITNRDGFELMNFLSTFFKEFSGIVDLSQDSTYHHFSIGRHIFYVYEEVLNNYHTDDIAEKELMLWTALTHDIGKKFCKSFRNRKGEETRYANFVGHENVSSQMAVTLLKRIGFNDEFIENVALLTQFHMYLLDENANKKKLLNYVGEDNYKRLEFLRNADTLAH